MTSTAAVTPSVAPTTSDDEVSLFRLYVLRAMYLLLVVGLGGMIVPSLLQHEPLARGVIASLLGAIWALAFLGLRYPLQMLPLLMFEMTWKVIWFVDFGLPQWLSGQHPPTFGDDLMPIVAGVVLMPLVIPWGYVYRQYFKRQGDRWR